MFPGKEDPIMILVDALLTGDSSKSITESEKRGQNIFVQSEVLPKKCNYCTREQLEKMGIVFGEDADDLFIYVTLPEDWKKVATDHPMWSNLVDHKGRKRAAIFYKAAFYDRDAHISLVRRFDYGTCPMNGWTDPDRDNHKWHVVIFDNDVVIREIGDLGIRNYKDTRAIEMYWSLEKEFQKQAEKWLNHNYPNWKDPLAYWD